MRYSVVLFLLWLIGFVVPLVGTIQVLLFIRRSRALRQGSQSPPPVTILKPLCGVDPGLEQNLESFFELDYPQYELIFSVGSEKDTGAIDVAEKLIQKHPTISARLIVGAESIGPNPKVCNLIRGYESARYEHILISDSNIRVRKSYLREMVEQFDDRVGIETSVVQGTEDAGIGGALEACYLNSNFARGMVFAKLSLRRPCVMGKSMMFRKDVLERLGGLRSLASHLAEDYVSGERCRKAGIPVTLNTIPVQQHIGERTLREFWDRHVRWGRMRKVLAPPLFLFEPFLTSVGSGLMGALSSKRLFGISPALFLVFHFGTWLLSDLLVVRKISGRIALRSVWSWALGQLIHLPLWANIAAGNTVQWRGRKLKLNRDGTLSTAVQDAGLFNRWHTKLQEMSLPEARKLSWCALAVIALLTLAQTYSLRKLNTQYSLREFMPADHPLYQADTKVHKIFEISEEQPILVTLQLSPNSSGTWLKPENLTNLRATTDSMFRTPGIKKITSISNFETAIDTPQGIQVGNLLALTPPETWQEKLRSNHLLVPTLLSEDGKTALIVGDIGVPTAEQIAKMVSSIRNLLQQQYPDNQTVKTMVGGIVPLQSDMTFLINKELARFLLLGVLACVLTLMAYFRSFSTVGGCLLLAGLSNIAALSFMAVAHVPFSILSTTLPVLASITALAIGSHTFLNFGNAWEKESQKNQAQPLNKVRIARDIYASLALPNFLMALTTAIGFATLGGSNVPLMRQFALSVSIGILLGWFSVSIALPALMILLPIPASRRWTAASATWALGVMRFKHLLVTGVLAGCILLVVHGLKLNWSVQLFDDLPNSGSIKASSELIDHSLGGMIPLDLLVKISGESSPWNEPARIEKLDSLLNDWRKNPVVGSALGLPEFLKAGRAFGQGSSRQSIAETLFLLSMAENNPLNHFLNAEGDSTRLALRLRDVPAAEMESLIQKVRADVQSAFPNAEITTGGMASLVHVLNADLSKDLISGLWQSLFWISILMVIIFGSLRWALVAAIPNLLAPLVLLATMAILKTPIKPAVAVIFSIALGVAYNNTVYLMTRLRDLRKQITHPLTCIRETWYQEGNPCLFSSLAIFGGFAVFLSSYFQLNRTFGAYMLWSIGVGLFGDLVFMPALLGIFPQFLFVDSSSSQSRSNFIMKFRLPLFVIAITGLILSQTIPTHAETPSATSADEIMNKVAKNLHSKDESAKVKMTIVEASGSEKERNLKISRLETSDGQSVLVRLLSPADLRGTSLLSVTHGSQADQWLYLPSSKQTRRILSGKRSANFLDSELSYEDMGNIAGNQLTHQILRTEKNADGPVSVVESKMSSNDSAYSRVLTWISMNTDLASKIEYYDRSGALLKTTEMSNYQRFANGVWRAQKMTVKNAQNQRATRLELQELKIDQGLSASDFSPAALGNP